MEINEEKLFSVMEDITREQYDNLSDGETLKLSEEVSMYKYDHNYETMSVYDDDEDDAPTHCVIQYNGEDIFVVQTNEDSLEFTDIYGL
tara:strand:- start:12111 stop:12377 length:267 start_codon:yes stop_codon:yes gene_type:complete